MEYKWIMIEKETGRFCLWSNAKNKPFFGNNGHEKDTSETHEWLEWNTTLPEDQEQEMFYQNGNLVDSGGEIISLPEEGAPE